MKDPFGFVDTGAVDPARFARDMASEPAEWYVKKPAMPTGELLPGHVRLENGAVVTFEVAHRLRELQAAEYARAQGDDSWRGMCEHMRALWLIIEASPITFSGGEGVDADCSACGRSAIDVELARNRTKA